MSLVCPFARLSLGSPSPEGEDKKQREDEGKGEARAQKEEEKGGGGGGAAVSGRCPLGYDSGSFKLGPLSCVICHALLFDTCKCIPCGHLYCRFCISRFNDCPLCGASIEDLEPDSKLQNEVDCFIEGHARVKRSVPQPNEKGSKEEDFQTNVMYEDVSLARGTFLVQQALRAFQAQNLESAKARLSMCATDIREELERSGSTSEICSQLGAVLGMLGDCSRAMGDSECAIKNYKESVELLSSLPNKDAEVIHALSVSYNKIGDLKYYAQDLEEARRFYSRALEVRRNALTGYTHLSAQVLDVAVSLAKVADVDRALGNDNSANEGFHEAVKALENLSAAPNNNDSLERRRISVLEFLHGQIKAGGQMG